MESPGEDMTPNSPSVLPSMMMARPNSPHRTTAGKTYRVGWLQPSPIPDPWIKGFRQGLQEFNYVEGKNVIIEYRWGDGNFDRLPAMAAELVRLNPDVIISVNTAALLALQKATTTIPIVMLGTADPVALGLVRGLARPGANITGMSVMGLELSRKRLELLKEAVPNLDRVTVLSNSGNPAVVLALQETRGGGTGPRACPSRRGCTRAGRDRLSPVRHRQRSAWRARPPGRHDDTQSAHPDYRFCCQASAPDDLSLSRIR